MTITTGKAVHDRFRNKIPNFLEHLPVWNDTPMSETHLTPVRYKFNNRKGDIIPFTTRHCVICGAVFDVVLVPTGLKCQIDSDKYLGLHMRSSVAINNKVCLIHGQGIIDADYYNNEKNEGHIMIPLINMGKVPFYVKEGERLVQGIFTPYGTTVNDAEDIKECRKGGFGSTGR
jgi:DUTP diphosphatase|nr:MAG TPA: deoxyuridine 5'-triphosphate nucleotidohydrolase [Caudoviricetes sp.]